MVDFASYCGYSAVRILADEVAYDAEESIVGIGKSFDFEDFLWAGYSVLVFIADDCKAKVGEFGVDHGFNVDCFTIGVSDGAVDIFGDFCYGDEEAGTLP